MAIKKSSGSQAGFTLIETMVAMVVLTIGLMSVATVFSSSLEIISLAQADSIAQHEAQQMIEGIFAARNTGAIAFAASRTRGGTRSRHFQGWIDARISSRRRWGHEYADDGPALDVGPDGKPSANFQRQIAISTVFLQDGVSPDPNERKVQVWVKYTLGRMTRTYTQVTYVSTFR